MASGGHASTVHLTKTLADELALAVERTGAEVDASCCPVAISFFQSCSCVSTNAAIVAVASDGATSTAIPTMELSKQAIVCWGLPKFLRVC